MAERPLLKATSFGTRLKRMFNNAVNTQYFPIRFARDEPVWVLGVAYGQPLSPSPHPPSHPMSTPTTAPLSAATAETAPSRSHVFFGDSLAAMPNSAAVISAAASAAAAPDAKMASLRLTDDVDLCIDDSYAAGGGGGGGGGGSFISLPPTAATAGPARHLQRSLSADSVVAADPRGLLHIEQESEPVAVEGLAPFLRDVMWDLESRLWFTYREGFECIHNSKFTSDVGWGCMLRSGQMMLGHALLVHLLGRGWRFDRNVTIDMSGRSGMQEMYHRIIIKLFDDKFANHCPFSVHHLLRHVIDEGVAPGDWLGPTTVCRAICQAINERPAALETFSPVKAYCATDGSVSRTAVFELAADVSLGFVALLILVPLRLGLKEVNPIYLPALKALLTHPQCVGFIGGRPKHSLYFVGFQGDSLVTLDPHVCRVAVDVTSLGTPLDSYHCPSPRKLALSALDPSLALGFFCQSAGALGDFLKLAFDLSSERFPLFNMVH